MEIKKILIIRSDRFGEFILNTPAIKAVKNKFPAASITLMVSPAVKEIVEGWPIVDEILVYPKGRLQGILSLVSEFRKRKFDLAVVLNPKKEFHIATFLAGIPVRVGYERKFGFLLSHKIQDRKQLGQKHEVEYNLDLLKVIGIKCQDKSLFVSFDREDEETVNFLLGERGVSDTDNIVVVHPWTSDPVKQWPVKHFSQLAQRLLTKVPCRVVIIGGKDEVGQSEEFCKDKIGLINITGKLTLRQLAAFLRRCRLLVSNDSGPVHMAAAVGTPVVALFRSDLPGKTAKRWGPWGQGHIIIEKSSLYDITVDEVFDKVKEVLKR